MKFAQIGRQVFRDQILELTRIKDSFGEEFDEAVEALIESRGRIIFSGIGKSGLIAKKIAATMSSTGSCAYFVHPVDALHGDLGMILKEDIFVGLSFSGKSEELSRLYTSLQNNGNVIISITGNRLSPLAMAGTHHIEIPVRTEACPLQLAPTTSSTAMLVMGDALSIALMRAKEFNAEAFAKNHPGGSLGFRLTENYPRFNG